MFAEVDVVPLRPARTWNTCQSRLGSPVTLTLNEFGPSSDVAVWQAFLLAAFSFGVGVLGGLIGLALGTVRLPVLILVGLPAPTAAGTNILISTASAMMGSVRHLHGGRVNLRLVALMMPASLFGALIGGIFGSEFAPESLLMTAVGLLVVWQGLDLVRLSRSRKDLSTVDQADSLGVAAFQRVGRYWMGLGVASGFLIGVVGATVGLILGTLRLPVLVRFLRVDPVSAVGTNLVIGFFVGMGGWIGHVALGEVDYVLAVLMVPSAMAGSHVGAGFTGRITPRRLIAAMGVILATVGAVLVLRGVSSSF